MDVATDPVTKINAAKAALEGARAAHDRCPSGENLAKVDSASEALDKALDLWASQSPAS